MDKEIEQALVKAESGSSKKPAAPAKDNTPPKAKAKIKDESWEFIRVLFYALTLATIIRSLLFEPFHIPSGSMKSTLLIGDYLFVSKFSYGYSRYSFPLGIKFFDGRIFDGDKPERGDIVVFRPPEFPNVDYIKRLIGLPGDKIQVKSGLLYINGKPVELERTDDFLDDSGYMDTKTRIKRYIETLPNGVRHMVLDETPIGEVDDTSVYTVPEGHYFMMGDNRDNSTDSRYESVGFIPAENLVGKAQIIFFSTDDSAHFWEIWKWLPAMRPDRFFKLL